MASQGRAEYIIEDVAGCGRFQITFYMFIVLLVKLATSYNSMFMSFGNYNPGWRCAGNATSNNETEWQTTTVNNLSTEGQQTVEKYVINSCEDYRKCDDVEFHSDTSTIVSEWGLVCDYYWIVNVIISLQMLGMLIGSFLGGQLSDRIGRRKTVCINLAVCCVAQIMSALSVSWIMVSVSRFFIGMTSISNNILMYLYLTEIVTRKWRAVSLSIPIWSLGSILVALVALITEDWRKVEGVGLCITALGSIPFVLWAPESLRWLEVNNRREEFVNVSKKILKMNKKNEPSFEELTFVEREIKKKYNGIDLFRKGYRVISICVAFLHFASSLLYYAISFGAKSFYGNFYFNLFMINVIPLPIQFLSLFAIKTIRRRQYTVLFLCLTALCSIVSLIILLVGDSSAREFGSTFLICLSKAMLDASWAGTFAFNTELYPTVVRGVALGMGSLAARVGGIIAPFLIPNDESVLYIFMIIMTVLVLVCCGVCLQLPETKGKKLKETFEDEEGKDRVEMEQVI